MCLILITKGSKYDCNLFWRGSNMSANSKIALSTSNSHFWTNLVKRNISISALIFVPYQKRMHSYLYPFVIRIAHIFGPQRDQDAVIYGTLHDRVVSGPPYKLYYTFIFKLYNHFAQTIGASFLFQLNL